MSITVSHSSLKPSATTCDDCHERPAAHTTYQRGAETRRCCCRCYVLNGNPPADWHRDCMATYYEMNPDKKAETEEIIRRQWQAAGMTYPGVD